ncbi:MAG: hypothetical protein NTW38_08010 [Candidatus Aminicenantes bacterium]|nr:hypothetical protein [Candidatus Aminicenantes bacterium]
MQFTITCQNSSIFDGGNIGGTITLKYPGGVIEIGSGATVTITGDSSLSISDLIVSVSGFINSYVLTTNGYGTPLTTRDENGFKAFSITSKNITLINHLIPSDLREGRSYKKDYAIISEKNILFLFKLDFRR